MKKSIPLFLVGFLLATACFSQSIYDISFNDIDGNSISISQYQGKKVLFLVAPIGISDSLLLNDIQSFQYHFKDSIKIIGILSNEDGYSSANKDAIKALFQNRNINIVLTEGMYTHKSSGASQSSLLKWLTYKNQNSRFDTDVSGIGHKFFLGRIGKMFGSIPGSISLQDPICDWMAMREL